MNIIIKNISRAWKIFRLSISGKEANILDGNIDRAIILLAIPMTLEMVMESLFAVVDIFFVSRIGVDAIAAVGLTESLLTITYSLGFGVAMGTTAMIARRVGEKKISNASVSAAQSVYLGVLTSLPIMIAGIFYSADLLRLMGASESVIANGVGYTKLIYSTNIIIILLFLFNGIFRGAGDAALAMRTLWISNGLNIVLDPMLIMGIGPFPKLGIEGAAVATIIGRSVGIIYQVYHLNKGQGIIKIHKTDWHFNPDVLKRLVKLSVGVTAQNIIGSASWIFLMRIISNFGSIALAGYTVAIRIVIFTLLPSWGISNAAATMIGQNLGANQIERAEKSVWHTGFYNMAYMLIVMLVFLLFAENITAFFAFENGVIAEASKCLKIVALGYLFYSWGMVLVQSFNGAGDTRTPTIMHFFIFWLMQLPLAYLFAVEFSFKTVGVYWAIVSAESLFTVVGYFLFKKGRWKTVKV